MTNNQLGMLWIMASVLGATAMSLSVRGLGGAVPLAEIIAVRCAIGTVVAAILIMRFRSGPVWNERWRWHLLRGGLTVGALYFGYWSLTNLPMATVTVLFFTAPLWVTILSIPVFGERVGWRRALAMASGFLGVVIVLRPSPEGIDLLLLVPLASSVCFGVVLLLGKHLSKSDPPELMMLYAMFMALAVSSPLAAGEWVNPDLASWGLLMVVSISGLIRSYADIRGYAIGEPAVLVPVQYTRLIFVAMGAYVFFQEIPDNYTIAGAAVIVASTLYIAQRERKLAAEGRIKQTPGGAGP